MSEILLIMQHKKEVHYWKHRKKGQVDRTCILHLLLSVYILGTIGQIIHSVTFLIPNGSFSIILFQVSNFFTTFGQEK